jgi:hypothetical protein
MLARELKGRHLQMIAIGGSIGTLHFSFVVPGESRSKLDAVMLFEGLTW